MKTAAVYTRVSTDEQAREGYSLDAQLKAIKKYAQNNDILIDSKYIFSDEGISGRKAEKRPAFMEMIKQAKSKPKKFDLILVHKFDRFARNREDSVVYKSLLKKEYGIPVISISEPLDPDDKMSVIMEAFLEAMAEYYSLNLSGEVKKGQLEKHSKGELQTNPSFGYDVSNNKLIINENESKVVKMIFEQYAIDNLPMMNIAKNINALNIKTKRGSHFENRTIYYMLNNPVYIGKLRYTPGRRNSYDFDDPNTILVDGQHEPIIDLELWNSVQMKLAKNAKWKKPKQHIDLNPKHWTKGLVRCKECGCTMVTCGKTKLRCNGYNKGKCSNSTTLLITEIYDLIINNIKQIMKNGKIEHIVANRKEKKENNQYLILQHQLEQLSDKEIRIKEAYREGVDTIDEYKENKNIILREKSRLLKELETVEKPKIENKKKEIIENGKKIYEILIDKKISLKEKNEVAHILINKVEYDPNSNTLELYYN
mgnify:CR=1 FL=1